MGRIKTNSAPPNAVWPRPHGGCSAVLPARPAPQPGQFRHTLHPADPPQKFFDPPIFAGVKGQDGNPAARVQTFRQVTEQGFQRAKLVVLSNAQCLKHPAHTLGPVTLRQAGPCGEDRRRQVRGEREGAARQTARQQSGPRFIRMSSGPGTFRENRRSQFVIFLVRPPGFRHRIPLVVADQFFPHGRPQIDPAVVCQLKQQDRHVRDF